MKDFNKDINEGNIEALITSIVELGKISEADDLTPLLATSRAKQVLAIELRSQETEFIYIGVSQEQVKKQTLYLYQKDSSGKPGLFLSWRISLNDVRDLKKAISGNDIDGINEFRRRKISWISRPTDDGYESDLKLLKLFPSLTQNHNSVLPKILMCLAKNHEEIWNCIKDKINEFDKAEELLVTIKIDENGAWKYLGEYPEFVDLIRKFMLGSRG